jgi:hypothetical protein
VVESLKATIRTTRQAFVGEKPSLPAIVAVTLFVFQLSIPWTTHTLVTEDGPSHLYTSIVARNLFGNHLLHRNSHYGELYKFNPTLVPNWGSSLLLSGFVTVAGPEQAEKFLMSVCLIVGFMAMSYAIRSFSPDLPSWLPLANVLIQVWFLWLGFYNFYLGMVLSPFVVGYFVRNILRLTIVRAALVGAGLCVLFLTHLISAAIAGLVILTIAIWVYLIVPALAQWRNIGIASIPFPESLYPASRLILMMVPTLGLLVLFVRSSSEAIAWHLEIGAAFSQFPMHVFETAPGRVGAQFFIWPVLLFLIAVSLCSMRRVEWLSATGGLAFAIVAVFVLYLVVPDRGLGGGEARIRVSWGVCLWGGILVSSVRKLRDFQIPLAIYLFAFTLGTLWSTENALMASSRAVEDYLTIAGRIRRGSTFVRLRFPTPSIPRKFGFNEIGRDPLFHVDSFIASACKCVNLSDYQAPNNIFPIVFGPSVERPQQFGLWSLEGPTPDTAATLAWLRNTLPIPIDYVIVLEDETPDALASPTYQSVMKELGKGMRLIATSQPDPFVKLYERVTPR